MPHPDWVITLNWLTHHHQTTEGDVAQAKQYFGADPEELNVCYFSPVWGRRWPLHLAASRQRGTHAVQLVKVLVKLNPGAARIATERWGYLPLHYVARYQKGDIAMAMTRVLLKAYPAGSRVLSRHCELLFGTATPKTPLRLAEKYSATRELMNLLYDTMNEQTTPYSNGTSCHRLLFFQ